MMRPLRKRHALTDRGALATEIRWLRDDDPRIRRELDGWYAYPEDSSERLGPYRSKGAARIELRMHCKRYGLDEFREAT